MLATARPSRFHALFAARIITVMGATTLSPITVRSAPPDPAPAGADGLVTARLSGKVTDVAGKPVAGASVLFNRATGARMDLNAAGLRATTDPEGRYQLSLRFAGSQLVVREVFAEAKGYTRSAPELEIPLRGGDAASVDFSMVPGEVLAGEVRIPPSIRFDTKGMRQLLLVDGPSLDRLSENARAYMTEPGGKFEIYLPAGRYTLRTPFGGPDIELKDVATGRRDVILAPAPFAWTEEGAGKIFDELCQGMDRQYSYFFLKKDVDWAKLTAEFRPKAAAAKDADAFAAVLQEMLAALHDLHVRVETSEGMLPTYRSVWRYNGNAEVTRARLQDMVECGEYALVGKTKGDGFGYFLMLQQSAATPESVKQAADAVRALRDTTGLVVDLRRANGGSEPLAADIARLFCATDTVYAKSKYRNGPGHEDFGKEYPRKLKGSPDAYTKPVVCLTGPGAVSSGEGFVEMMKCLPHVTTVGLPTRGASGNPKPLELGRSGVTVWFSRWVDMTPDGKPFEGVGIVPDVNVDEPLDAYATADPTLDKALAVLREKTSAAKPAGQ